MAAQLAAADLPIEDRLHFHFALGKAFEDAGVRRVLRALRGGQSAAPGACCATTPRHDDTARPAQQGPVHDGVLRTGRDSGAPAPDPIFVVGLPRAGSTLVEQILASHSAVEGTMELPDVVGIAVELGGRRSKPGFDEVPGSTREPGAPMNFAPWVNATCGRRASSARRTRRSSSTSCRTTGRTSA